MSQVTVIGLGNMGSALARALLDAPQAHAVTVWNRSPEKAVPLVEKGAVLPPYSGAALAASPIILICVTSYAAANHILGEAGTDFSGKVLIQFTTGSPQEAREIEAWAHEQGAEYLDCAITGSPSSIGTPNAHILVAGREAVFQKAEPILRVLANNLDYKGEFDRSCFCLGNGVPHALLWDVFVLISQRANLPSRGNSAGGVYYVTG